MQYRRLGKSDPTISAIGMVCMQFGDKADLPKTERIVGRALDRRRMDFVLATKMRMGVATIIPNASRHDQLAETVGAADWKLALSKVQEIDVILAGSG